MQFLYDLVSYIVIVVAGLLPIANPFSPTLMIVNLIRVLVTPESI